MRSDLAECFEITDGYNALHHDVFGGDSGLFLDRLGCCVILVAPFERAKAYTSKIPKNNFDPNGPAILTRSLEEN